MVLLENLCKQSYCLLDLGKPEQEFSSGFGELTSLHRVNLDIDVVDGTSAQHLFQGQVMACIIDAHKYLACIIKASFCVHFT